MNREQEAGAALAIRATQGAQWATPEARQAAQYRDAARAERRERAQAYNRRYRDLDDD